MDPEPFIVTLSGAERDFREALAVAVPQAEVIRVLSAGTLVVVLPRHRSGELRALPGVAAVAPDELRHLHGHGRSSAV